MKHPVYGTLLIALMLAAAACGKNETTEAVPATAPSQANAPDGAMPATTQATDERVTPAADSQARNTEAAEEVTEQIAETEEGAETKDDPAAKTAVPLKLAQLPPRAATSSKFKEGVNYTRLSPTQPVSVSPDKVEVVEFFWYGCPHCEAIDPLVETWRKTSKPEYVVFSRVPGAWSDIARFHGRFYFAAESLGKLEELHPLIFRELHQKGNPLNTIDKAREFFAAHGVDAQSFQKNFGAMSLERKLDEANTLAQRYRVTGVPMFVVNGKFTLDVASAGNEEQVFVLLNELAAREYVK